MKDLSQLLEKNKGWVEKMKSQDPNYFDQFETQSPEYLWIGCCDSRVPATQIVDIAPGDMFVHRNIANMVSLTDISCMSAIKYAVDVLKVKHIIVCGHYGCGGVQASMNRDNNLGIIDHWLWELKLIYEKYEESLNKISDEKDRWNLLCEINVKEQVSNLAKSLVVSRAWTANQDVTIHGWIYGINDGILKDLNISCNSNESAKHITESLKTYQP